jgi:hypothetical protein
VKLPPQRARNAARWSVAHVLCTSRGLIQAGLDVLGWPDAAWVRTSDQQVWRGKVHPVVPRRVPAEFRREVERMQALVAVGEVPQEAPRQVRLPSQPPPAETRVMYG